MKGQGVNQSEGMSFSDDNLDSSTKLIPQSIVDIAEQNRKITTIRVLYQIFIFSLTFFNYAVLHATRSAWSNASPTIESDYGYTATLLSQMNACFLGFYAFGGIFTGHLGDSLFKQKKFYIGICYVFIALEVALMGSQYYFSVQHEGLYFAIKILDGVLQSMAWATNLSILCNFDELMNQVIGFRKREGDS